MERYSQRVDLAQVRKFMEGVEAKLEPYSGTNSIGTLIGIQRKQRHPDDTIDALRTHYGYLKEPKYQDAASQAEIKRYIAKWEAEVGPERVRESREWQHPELTVEEIVTMFMCRYRVDISGLPDDQRAELESFATDWNTYAKIKAVLDMGGTEQDTRAAIRLTAVYDGVMEKFFPDMEKE